ncbi:MAG: hypothetical protein ABSF34_05550 [Verrucomicrobiota bacterium]
MSTLPNILPTATADLFQNDATTTLPGKPGEGGEQFDHLMARALLNPTGDKNAAADQNLNRGKVGSDHFQLDLKSSKFIPPTYIPSTSDAASAYAATAAKVDSSQATAKTTLPTQISESDGQFNHLMTSLLLPATAAGQNLDRGKINADASADTVPLHPKDAKSATQTPDTSQTNPVGSQPDAARNATAQTEINNAAIAAGNPPPPTLTPVAAINGLKMASEILAASQPASILPVLSGAKNSSGVKNLSATGAKISSLDAPRNQPEPETRSKIQTSGQKINVPANGLESMESLAGTNAIGSKITALAPVTEQIPPVANEVNGEVQTLKLAAKPAENSQPSGLSPVTASDTNISTSAQSIVNGTPSAQQDGLMNSGGKPNKTADLTGKFLPGSVTVFARGDDLPIKTDQMTATAAAVGVSTQSNPTTATVSAADSVESFAGNAQALERTHDLVAAHALRVSDVGTDSLQVVIKPGAGTQLSLELRQRDGGVEVQASLQQGDFKNLSQHWPELQQRLEQRGIRLASLTDDGSLANSDSGTFKQNQNQSGEALAELGLATRTTGTFTQPTSRVKAAAGWETWA